LGCARAAFYRAEVRPPLRRQSPASARRRSSTCRSLHDRVRPELVGAEQHDLCPPHVLLRRVAVLDQSSEPIDIGGPDGKGKCRFRTPQTRTRRVRTESPPGFKCQILSTSFMCAQVGRRLLGAAASFARRPARLINLSCRICSDRPAKTRKHRDMQYSIRGIRVGARPAWHCGGAPPGQMGGRAQGVKVHLLPVRGCQTSWF
jgi:hypothetical protein